MDKTKIEIRTEILNELIKLKNVGDTYSDVIRRLLDEKKKRDDKE
jgi:predicted CopG family antitoxin